MGGDYFRIGLEPVDANNKATKAYLKGDEALVAAIDELQR